MFFLLIILVNLQQREYKMNTKSQQDLIDNHYKVIDLKFKFFTSALLILTSLAIPYFTIDYIVQRENLQ